MGVVVEHQPPAPALAAPVGQRCIFGVELDPRGHVGAEAEEVPERAVDHAAMRDAEQGLAGMLASEPGERTRDPKLKNRPALRARIGLGEGMLLEIEPAEAGFVVFQRESVGLGATAKLLKIVVEREGEGEGESGRKNLGGLAGTRETAGKKDIGDKLTALFQPVMQRLRLLSAKLGQARVALGPGHGPGDIDHCLAVAHQK